MFYRKRKVKWLSSQSDVWREESSEEVNGGVCVCPCMRGGGGRGGFGSGERTSILEGVDGRKLNPLLLNMQRYFSGCSKHTLLELYGGWSGVSLCY